MTKGMKKKVYNILFGLAIVVVAYLLNEAGIITNKDDLTETNSLKDTTKYTVTRVVDGDTIVLSQGEDSFKVRLIGVDTPESVHPNKEKNTEFGKIANNYTKEKLLNKEVALELDVQETDKYGRILAYVYIDGVMFNKMLLQSGMAKIATYPPNVKYVEEFKVLEKQARENKVGLWSDEYS